MRWKFVAGLLVVAALVSACSDDDQEPAEPTDEAAQQTLQAWLEAMVAGDDAACDLETEAFATSQNDNVGFYRDGDSPDCAGRVADYRLVIESDGTDFDEYAAAVVRADYEIVSSLPNAVVVKATYPGTDLRPDVYGLEYDGRWLVAEGASALLPEFEKD